VKWSDLQRVFLEDDEVGILTRLQCALDLIVELLVSGLDGEGLQSGLRIDALVWPKHLVAAGATIYRGPPKEQRLRGNHRPAAFEELVVLLVELVLREP